MEEIVKLAETVKEPVKYFLGHLLSMDEKPQMFTIEEVNKIIQETNYIIEENKYIVAEAVTKTIKVEYTKKIIICVLVLIILAIIGYFIYKHFFKEEIRKDKEEDKEKSSQ